MDKETLRSEFERLSAEFPQLRLALRIRHGEFDPTELGISALVARGLSMQSVDSYELATDGRSAVEVLWASDDPADAADAERLFIHLANHAARSVETKTLEGSEPRVWNWKTHHGVKDEATGLLVASGSDRDESFDRWVTHLFAQHAPWKEDLQLIRENRQGRFVIYLLPWDAFRASALALTNKTNEQNNSEEVSDFQRDVREVKKLLTAAGNPRGRRIGIARNYTSETADSSPRADSIMAEIYRQTRTARQTNK